jgi:hypothetical protein
MLWSLLCVVYPKRVKGGGRCDPLTFVSTDVRVGGFGAGGFGIGLDIPRPHNERPQTTRP